MIVNFIRGVFSLFCSMAPLLLFAVLRREFGGAEALLGAIILLGSWHFFFHARWVAPDALQVTTICAMMLFVSRFLSERHLTSLLAVSAFAGILTATKYPAGIFLLTPLLLAFHCRVPLQKIGYVVLVFAGTFLLITPGLFFESGLFFRDIIYEIRHYGENGHGVYSIRDSGILLSRIAEYLFLALPHHNPFIALPIGISAILGGIIVFKERRGFFVSVAVPAFIYLLYFWSQDVMIVRNYLIVWPIMSLFSAVGIVWLIGCATRQAGQQLAAFGAVAVILVLVSVWQFSLVVRSVSVGINAEQAAQHLVARQSDGAEIYVSQGLKDLLEGSETGRSFVFMALEEDKKSDVSAVMYRLQEFQNFRPAYTGSASYGKGLLANSPGLYTHVSGPQDVDLDYYPTWKGKDRIVLAEDKAATTLSRYILPVLYRATQVDTGPARLSGL